MDNFVNGLNAAGEAFVTIGVRMLVQSSVLILALLVLDLVLRKRVKAVARYWIWLLVLVKLVLPPSLASPTSLAWWLGGALPETRVTLAEAAPEQPRETPLPPVWHEADRVIAAGAPAVPMNLYDTPLPVQVVSSVERPTWKALVFVVWLATVAVMLALLVQRALFVRRLVLQSQEAPERMLDLLAQCRRQMGVRTPVRLRSMSPSASPSVCGLWRPTILIPQRMLVCLDGRQLKSILLHELAHVRRADLWVNLAQTLLQIVYVFHPLVWPANAMIRRVREQAVDETVLAAMGKEAEEYPRTLLTISKLAFGQPSLTLRLIGVVESKRTLTARIRHIVSRPFPTTARLGLAGLVLMLAVGAVLLPMAKARPDTEATAESVASAAPAATNPEDAGIHPQEAPAPVGVVVDERGEPVEGARILLYHRKSRRGLGNRVVEEARTDAEGRFALTAPLVYENNNGTTYTDHFLLFATHPDHAMAWHVIVAGQEKAEYRLTMTEPVAQAFRVTDREGNPLAGARVWIFGAGLDDDPNPLLRPYVGIPEDIGLLTAITDGQGRTTLGNLPRTLCSVRASMPGYSHRYVRVGVPPQNEAHVEMTQAGTATGRVLTAEGRPVVGAVVSFQADWGEWYFEYAITDETGQFFNDSMVARGGSWVQSGGSGQYKVTIRHPDFTAPEFVVQLEPGQTDAFDIEAVEGTLLRIRVLEPETERPIPGARVQGFSASGRLDGYSDANGLFERRVLNGEASVVGVSPPGGTYVLSGTGDGVRVLANGGVEDVTFYASSRLYPLVDIKGRLLLPDGSPAGGIRISTTNNLSSYSTATFGGTGSAYARTNPDGSFELTGVPREVEVFLYAETGGHEYVLAEVLDPTQASPELAQPLVMKEGGTASVVLLDESGKPRANMALKLRPRKWEHYMFRADDRSATTDAEGRLILNGIVPGLEYFIRDARANLSQSGWWDLYNENRVLLPLDGGPTVLVTPISAPEGAGTTISGVVVDAAGKPISGAYVSLENVDLLLLPQPLKLGSQMRKVMRPNDTRTDAQGRFHITDLNPGRTGISVKAQGYRTVWVPDVSTGTEGLRIVLGEPRPYQLSGVVVDEFGKGVPGVEVTFLEEGATRSAMDTDGLPITLRTDAAGVFRLDKVLQPVDTPGVNRMFLARRLGYGIAARATDTTGGIPSVRIVLPAEEQVSGTVNNESGEPIPGAAVALFAFHGPRDTLFFFPPTWTHLAPQAVTDSKGVFTLWQVPTESDVSLQVQAPGYASGTMRSVRTGQFGSYAIRRGSGADVMGGTGDPNAPLVITLQKAVTLRGTVVYEGTGRPAPGIRVGTQAQRGGEWSETVTDPQGRFEMTDVFPASCNLLVMVDRPSGDMTREWTAAAIRLDDLRPGEIRDGLRLVLTKGEIIRGRVTDSQGHPLKGIDIAFYSAARPRSGAACQSILTAEDGTWAHRFPPGEVYIYIRTNLPGAGWRRGNYTYNLTAGRTIENVDFVSNQAISEDSPHRGVLPGE
jgi:beta-lactamase regulating signal transducer with metallopeptidase domain